MSASGWTILVLFVAQRLDSASQQMVSEPLKEGDELKSTSYKKVFNETTINPLTNSPCPALIDMVTYCELAQMTLQPSSASPNVDLGFSVEFNAFNRTFSMYLHRATEMDSAIILPTTKVISFDSTGSRTQTVEDFGVIVLVGYEKDCPQCSRIYGTMYRDDLEFVLHSPKDSYFVEPISKHPRLNLTGRHLAVVYRRSDVRFTVSNDSTSSGKFSEKYANVLSGGGGYFPKRVRSRRHILANPGQYCDLLVVADHTYFEAIAHRSTEQAITDMINNIATADFVFRMTDFDGDSVGEDIGFSVGMVHVFLDATAPGYTMRRVDTGPEDTLIDFTSYSFAKFCVAIAFTFRDFGVTLGISFKAGPADMQHGICAQQGWLAKQLFTMNTVMVTQLSHGKVIPRAIMSLIATHEFGHSFGAEHDNDFPNLSCNPLHSSLGNYVMHSTHDIYDFLLAKNDWTFSPCSVNSMRKVIAFRKDVCFLKRPFPVCGNLMLDYGEQCDCGNLYSCAILDPCCRPPPMSFAAPNNGCVYATEKGCQCSPRWDQCCTSSGSLRGSADAFVCRAATDCTGNSVCDGRSASCPVPTFYADETACAGGEGRCQSGVCSRSVCALNGLADCSCQWPESAKCKVCCGCIVSSGQVSSCLPAEWLALSLGPGRDMVQSPIYLLPGMQCDRGKGKCSNDAVCMRPV